MQEVARMIYTKHIQNIYKTNNNAKTNKKTNNVK